MARLLPLGFLVSGEGTILEELSEAIAGGHLSAKVALVVADRPHAPAIERARRRGLPTIVIPSHGVPEALWSSRLTRALLDAQVELVVLAGFLSILPPGWVREWEGRAINVHPSLLPKFGGPGMYGRTVHEAVLRSGERRTGVTIHLVTDAVDAGPTLLQETIDIRPDDRPDSLRERLRPLEVRLLIEVIRKFAEGTLSLPYSPPEESAPAREGTGTPEP